MGGFGLVWQMDITESVVGVGSGLGGRQDAELGEGKALRRSWLGRGHPWAGL